MDRKIAIWGTGNIYTQIIGRCPCLMPVKLIDNDLGKSGMVLNGIEIIHPSHIMNWQEFFVILALDNYISVKRQLEKIGLKEKVDFVWYRDWGKQSEIEDIIKEAEEFLDEIELHGNAFHGYKIIFSDFLSFDKGLCDYVNKWNLIEGNMVLLSEAAWVSRERKNMMSLPILELPMVLLHNKYLLSDVGRIPFEYNEENGFEKRYLNEAVENLRLGFPDMADGYEFLICYYAEKIVQKIIEIWKPSQVILWNAFYALHFIIRNICEVRQVPIKYMEFGNIPGTIILEETGQMGESWPARYPKEFMKIPVSGKEYREAELLIQKLHKSGLNRNVQPQNDKLYEVKQKLKPDRPVIFYAGQNDNACGMQPYTENTRRFHSPVFKSSDEAALFLAEICKKNEWNYIYKPHPMMARNCSQATLPENVIFVDDVDINGMVDLSDVVVTILSTVSYIGLIRQKPVVMLGYTQLKEKGCTYEAFDRNNIEFILKKSFYKGLTIYMKEAFIHHIAKLKKYYHDLDWTEIRDE